jgi:hypothetical protein
MKWEKLSERGEKRGKKRAYLTKKIIDTSDCEAP